MRKKKNSMKKTTYKMYHHKRLPKDVKKSAGISNEYTGFVR